MFALANKHKRSAANCLSIWTFIKETRLVVTVKKLFVSRDGTKLMAHFGIFGLAHF